MLLQLIGAAALYGVVVKVGGIVLRKLDDRDFDNAVKHSQDNPRVSLLDLVNKKNS